MKKLLLCLLSCAMLCACSKDDDVSLPQNIGVSFNYANGENVTDQQVLVYDVNNSNEYMGSFTGSSLELMQGNYHFIAVANCSEMLENKEDYLKAKIRQQQSGEHKNFVASKIMDFPADGNISFEMEQVNGGIQIVSTDTESVGLDSVRVSIQTFYDYFQLYNSKVRGDRGMTVQNTFPANGGVGFNETLYLFAGDSDVKISLDYYVDGELVVTKELGNAKVKAGEVVVKEVLFADDLIESVAIPDVNFLAALQNILPAEAFVAGKLLPDHESVKNLNELIIPKLKISDLTGIEYFTGLEKLDVHSNVIDTLNFENLVELKELNCEFCKSKSIDVSDCVLLETFNCSANKITSLDLSQNVKLKDLNCSLNFGFDPGTSLEQLDLSTNSELLTLNVTSCRLQSLDLSGKSLLTDIICEANFTLTSIDLTGCSSLENLFCEDNKIASLDLSDCSALKVLYCQSNHLTDLTLSETASDLVQVRAQGNSQAYTDISGLSASNHPNLSKLYISESALCGDNIKAFFTEGNWSVMQWGIGVEGSLTDYTLDSCQ